MCPVCRQGGRALLDACCCPALLQRSGDVERAGTTSCTIRRMQCVEYKGVQVWRESQGCVQGCVHICVLAVCWRKDMVQGSKLKRRPSSQSGSTLPHLQPCRVPACCLEHILVASRVGDEQPVSVAEAVRPVEGKEGCAQRLGAWSPTVPHLTDAVYAGCCRYLAVQSPKAVVHHDEARARARCMACSMA